MALNFLLTKLSLFPYLFQPIRDAIFSSLPIKYRWRLLALQPLNLLSLVITAPTWFFNGNYSVIYVPTRSGRKRCLVYQPPQRNVTTQEGDARREKRRPLHIDIHGGAWIGGFPEHTSRWCNYLAGRTGAVVVSISYRFAPVHTYPAAHNDVNSVVAWLVDHTSMIGADPALLTLGGSSAGGNMALSAAQWLDARAKGMSRADHSTFIAKAYVGFCPVLDLRLKPEDKPKPPGFPKRDLLSWMMPLYDSYAGPMRERRWNDPRLNTMVAEMGRLPRDMFFVIAGIDILAKEQLQFVERVKGELREEGHGDRVVQARVWDGAFHGWLELPKWILEKERIETFDAAVEFIKRVHCKHGFDVMKIEC